MDAPAVSLIVFVCASGGVLIGARWRTMLPEHHLSADSKDIVRVGTGLVGTMTALVLGLLIASAKSSYDTEKSEVIAMSAKIIFLDRTLSHYGADAAAAREALKSTTVAAIDRIWPSERDADAELSPLPSKDESTYAKILQLKPADDTQHWLKSQALGLASDIAQVRWLLFEQSGTSIASPFLVVLILWLTVLFISFGLFAPANSTVLVTLLVCALSVACAIYLVLELDHPFAGLIRIGSDPARNALAQLGR